MYCYNTKYFRGDPGAVLFKHMEETKCSKQNYYELFHGIQQRLGGTSVFLGSQVETLPWGLLSYYHYIAQHIDVQNLLFHFMTISPNTFMYVAWKCLNKMIFFIMCDMSLKGELTHAFHFFLTHVFLFSNRNIPIQNSTHCIFILA